MVYRILILIQIVYTFFYFGRGFLVEAADVLGATTVKGNVEIDYPNISHEIELSTKTAFSQKEVTEVDEIAYETIYEDDPELEYAKEEVKTAGVYGTTARTFLVTHWLDEEIDRTLLSTVVEPPTAEVISVGKKITWDELKTPDIGKIAYWAKLRVFATKYDSTCLGCNNTTALGAPVQEGVCAVDRRVIPMYTHFYVPGYGKCQALDVGGLIKGNRIDLAFRDASTASWGAEYVDIYLMDNVPEDSVSQ